MSSMRKYWENSINAKGQSTLRLEEERALYKMKVISDCEFEFGPHDTHDDCANILYGMNEVFDEPYDPEYDNYMNGSSHIGFSVSA
jgi:hypothetical protein